jgi:hypothetical protein
MKETATNNTKSPTFLQKAKSICDLMPTKNKSTANGTKYARQN